MLHRQNVHAEVVRVGLGLLVEGGAGAANLTRFVAPDVVRDSSSAQGRLRDFEDLALSRDEAHRGDALRSFVAHDGFLVWRALHGLRRPLTGVCLSPGCAPLGSYSDVG